MTGQKFESGLCELFKASGWWALNIPKNATGAQPFDVIAIAGRDIFAVDCKVCSSSYFSFDRIEDNQWLSFQVMSERTNAKIGIMAYYAGDIYFLPYAMLKTYQKDKINSLNLLSINMRPWWSKENIKKVLGRYME